MPIEYIWEFSNIRVKDTNKQKNIVHSFDAFLKGTLDTFSATETFSIVTSTEDYVESLIPFENLTKDQFIEWTEKSLGLIVEQAKSNIKYNLNNQYEKSKYPTINAPWA